MSIDIDEIEKDPSADYVPLLVERVRELEQALKQLEIWAMRHPSMHDDILPLIREAIDG